MRSLVRAAMVVAALAALIQVVSWQRSQPSAPHESSSLTSRQRDVSVCPPHTLLDNHACIPVPNTPDVGRSLPPTVDPTSASVPLRSDRAAPYVEYEWPVALTELGAEPDPAATLAVIIPQVRGVPVETVRLEHQVGDAEVLRVANIVGRTVVTLHTVRHSRGLRQYIVLNGRLSQVSPQLKVGAPLVAGKVLGKVGDSGQPGDVHLYLEVRQVRRNVDLTQLPAEELRHPARTIACDPRNVLVHRG